MEIKINNDPINFTLENEKNLGDIIAGIEKWLGNSGYLVSSIERDGIPVVMDYDGEWKETSLDDIDLLEITILTGPEQYVTNLHTVYQYISILQRSIASGNGDSLNNLREEHQFVVENLDALLGSPGYGAKLGSLLSASGASDGELKPQVQQLLTFCKNLSIILTGRIKEATEPFEELKNAAKGLSELVPQLMEVPVLLQTGKDKTAMGYVIEFTEYSDKLIRINHILKEQGILDISGIIVDGRRFDEFFRDFNDILRELLEAFDSQDSVLIGDLLEYEIAPRVETLDLYMDEIEKSNIKES
ncbi:MAG: hypothetical protein ACLFMZ_05045 [Spirochaetaceae bacterium]